MMADRSARPPLRASLRLLRRLLAGSVPPLAALAMLGSLVAFAQDGLVPVERSALRIAHLSPDAPRVDLLVDGRALLRDIAFEDVSAYGLVAAGRHEVRVYPHRPPESDDAARRIEPVTVFVDLEAGAYYTLVLAGFYEPPPDAARSGALSITVQPKEARLVVTGPRSYRHEGVGEALLEGLEPGSYDVTADLEGFRSITYRVEVAPLETAIASLSLQQADADQGAADAATPAPDPGAGVVAPEDAAAWHRLELHLYRDALDPPALAGLAQVRIVNASPIAPALRVEASYEPLGEIDPDAPLPIATLAEDLAFPNAGPYGPAPTGAVDVRALVTGSSNEVASWPDLPLEAGVTYTLFLVGDPSDNRLRIVPVVDALTAPVVAPVR